MLNDPIALNPDHLSFIFIIIIIILHIKKWSLCLFEHAMLLDNLASMRSAKTHVHHLSKQRKHRKAQQVSMVRVVS
jgi:hypothetical protein